MGQTGQVVEVHQFDQYTIHMNGSGLPTKRNRKFLRKFIPARQRQDRRHPIQHFRYVKPAPGKSDATSKPLQPNVTDIDSKPSETVTPAVTLQTQSPALDANNGTDVTEEPTAPPPPAHKLPLALRRLLNHNKKGLKE